MADNDTGETDGTPLPDSMSESGTDEPDGGPLPSEAPQEKSQPSLTVPPKAPNPTLSLLGAGTQYKQPCNS